MCVYCENRIWNVSRHMSRNHSKESLVQEALQHRLNSSHRRNAWKRITRLGDFNANIQLMKDYKEPLFVVRKREAKPDKELPCSMCKGFFKGSLIYKHRINCFMRSSVAGTHTTSTSRILLNSELAQDKFYDFYTEILANMKRGNEYHLHIQNDSFLLLFGSIEMQRKETNKYKDIRYTLRCIAKLMIEFKKVANLEDVSAKDLLLLKNFENIVTAMKNRSGYKGPRKIKTPHITLKLGFSLKTLADIVSLKYLKEGLDSQVSNCEKFLMLYGKEYSIYAKNAKAIYGK